MPPQSKAELRAWLKQDLESYIANGAFPAHPGRWRWYDRFRYPVIHWQRLMRRAEYSVAMRKSAAWLPFVLLVRWRFLRRSLQLNLEIPLNVFGPGLTVAHHGTIVVNSRARVGQNCRIHPGVCIGELKEKNPVLGDNIYLGNGAIIIGDVSVGDGARIGPHALVRKSVPEDSIVVAEQARELELPRVKIFHQEADLVETSSNRD